MSKLIYRTMGNQHPQGMPKVYFACHPDDLSSFLDSYALKIQRIQNCAICYESEYDDEYDKEELEAQLAEMQLIVIPITTRLLTRPNRARDIEFPFSQQRHIPVLPIMIEEGLIDLYKKYFGSLQYLNPNDTDSTRRSFDEVLEAYIKVILVSDELAEKIRNAFDAYIFLSYRKKDRNKAQKLMKLIHKNPLFQDIAIWYDEFLTPGEDFNDLINVMLKKSDIFALTVTPNLVNESNYVMTTEYPLARQADKSILPVEMEKTDRNKMAEYYEGIPEIINESNEDLLITSITNHLHHIALSENDSDPEHSFLIGLAYLDGIDVDIDYDKAVKLITSAAESNVPEAINQLITMYETGKGVSRDSATAIFWRNKQIELYREEYEKSKETESLIRYLTAVSELGNAYYSNLEPEKAEETYESILQISQQHETNYPKIRQLQANTYQQLSRVVKARFDYDKSLEYINKALRLFVHLADEDNSQEALRNIAAAFIELGRTEMSLRKFDQARDSYEKSLEIYQSLLQKEETLLDKRGLSAAYTFLGQTTKYKHKFELAEKYYLKALEINLSLANETWTVIDRRNLGSVYANLADIEYFMQKHELARDYYEKELETCSELAKETCALIDRRNLAISYHHMGKSMMSLHEFVKSKEYYEKAIELYQGLVEEINSFLTIYELQEEYISVGLYLSDSFIDVDAGKEYLKKAVQLGDINDYPELKEGADLASNALKKWDF